jgi:hypothetical protein
MIVRYDEVKGGDFIIGSQGNLSRAIEDAEPSKAIPGHVRIKTEHGDLHVEPATKVEIE